MNGARIRQLREQFGWTQAELADKLGVGMRSIGAWERGECEPRGRPRWELQQLLAKAENEGVTRAPDPPAAPTIREASDTELLLELLRRAAQKETP